MWLTLSLSKRSYEFQKIIQLANGRPGMTDSGPLENLFIPVCIDLSVTLFCMWLSSVYAFAALFSAESFLPKKSQGWDSWRQKAEKINKKWFQVSNPLSLNSVKCFTLSQQFSLPFLDCLVWKHDFQQWNAMCLLVRLLCENDLCAEFLFEKWKLYRL